MQKGIRQIHGQWVHKQTVQGTYKDAPADTPNTRGVEECRAGPGSCALLPDQHVLWALLAENPEPDITEPDIIAVILSPWAFILSFYA